MRKLFVLTMMALLIPLTGFAQEATSTLKQNMKSLGGLSKQIASTVASADKNQDNAVAAGKMVELFKVVYTQAADGVKDVPADQQAAALADFQNLIQQEIDLATQLQAAFLANDNQSAAAIFKQMSDIKHEGHDKYNQDN